MSGPTTTARRSGRSTLRTLARAVGWDLRLQLRHQIVTVALLVTAAYGVGLRLLPEDWLTDVTVLLVLADPTMIGFLFVGALVLFERGAGTLHAVAVTPLSPALYVWSKALSLTAISVVCATMMTAVGHGSGFRPLPLLVATVLTSLFFVFIGLAAVVRVRSLNEYLLIVPVFLVPLYLPLLGFLGLGTSTLYYPLPTQASLLLIQRSLEARPWWEAGYAVALLTLSCAAAFVWAVRSFSAHLCGKAGRA
ncbi:ABC transporter permease [Streptomyces sp. JJ38]|uniref:fluoroquinolone export ABC transporter permease subunit n=1 Tax=Streptomyces sp. JJ38 TaxID=2738128 RepID=UPI001C5A1D3C|nr:ABC transporter permease [Streptomyces sp. JJ38]MBW1597678.1 ABC transporter permease [Streptomyces sp. JJ38]